jgi:hypothetical protein
MASPSVDPVGRRGSVRYGYGIRINEIVELSESPFREQEVGSIKPDWDRRIIGTHTLAHVERLTVLDALRPRWRWELSRRGARPRSEAAQGSSVDRASPAPPSA